MYVYPIFTHQQIGEIWTDGRLWKQWLIFYQKYFNVARPSCWVGYCFLLSSFTKNLLNHIDRIMNEHVWDYRASLPLALSPRWSLDTSHIFQIRTKMPNHIESDFSLYIMMIIWVAETKRWNYKVNWFSLYALFNDGLYFGF